MMNYIDLTGKTFGRLTVVNRAGSNPYGGCRWLCKCQCGAFKEIDGSKLRKGETVSCGCFGREIRRVYNAYTIHDDIAFVHLSKSDLIMQCNVEDWMRLKEHDWLLGRNGYAVSRFDKKIHYFHLLIAREQMDFDTDLKYGVVDHIDGNRLNNKRENLRVTTQQVNVLNSKMKSNNKSGYPGVFKRKDTGKWQAKIYVSGRNIQLGCYSDFDEAVRARRTAEDIYHKPILESAKQVIGAI